MSARPALCGGYHVSGIPTAISNSHAAMPEITTEIHDESLLRPTMRGRTKLQRDSVNRVLPAVLNNPQYTCKESSSENQNPRLCRFAHFVRALMTGTMSRISC